MNDTPVHYRKGLVGVHDLALLGQACRLPGADTVEALWQVLIEGRNTVSPRPTDRWRVERFLHPRRSEPGFSYTFAGGYIDDPFAFDPSVFGISPREAEQIDPQQRLLLEVVWEALEDAGLTPSSLAGSNVGVYVGASNVDYQNSASFDPAAIESHFMTGNALSIISNRVSYIFDWRGPSFTIDSACSSSFVALAQALTAIEAGIVDTAVVAGVNLLLSPAPFIGFSRASMLSPTGLCRPFSAAADGYVRSEGAIAIVLKRLDAAMSDHNRVRAVVVAAGANSDGRTNGISLPSVEGQRRLLVDTYDRLGLDIDDLAFVEAHGTGTPVGDPIEARAIGEALGARRSKPLVVGSIKSNIGHLECVSGLAGLLKTTLALDRGVYPRTLFLDELNPHVQFEDWNLVPARAHITLDPNIKYAGICNYGFGGTNAHAVIRRATTEEARGWVEDKNVTEPARLLTLTAKSREALSSLASDYADLLSAPNADVDAIASATASERDLLDQRLTVLVDDAGETAKRLRRSAAGDVNISRLFTGSAASRHAKLAFVYSGNGAQWVGMGRLAFARNPVFRRTLFDIAALHRPLAGWSLVDLLHDSGLAERLGKTSIAQPLIFAIQVALTRALAENGIVPDVVLGHSVGEVAAAYVSGALTLPDAVHLIHHRSQQQEGVAGLGQMLAVGADETRVADLLATIERPDVSIAAVNSPSSVTVSGPADGIEAVAQAARKLRLATVLLGVGYPFHSSLLDGKRDAILAGLARLTPSATALSFVSSVTGDLVTGPELGADYWWQNVRQPVQYAEAVRKAAGLGATLFLEISPRPILVAATAETLRDADLSGDSIASLSDKDDGEGGDPVLATTARAITRGASADRRVLYGTASVTRTALPHYPWQRQRFVTLLTQEGIDVYGGSYGSRPSHPMLGRPVSPGSSEFRALIDDEVVPYLADHKVGGEVVVPAAALVELAFAAGQALLGEGPLQLRDFDISRPLSLASESMRELSTRFDDTASIVEIRSRRRLSGDGWVLHARGVLSRAGGTPASVAANLDAGRTRHNTGRDVYQAARLAGLDYGPLFRLVTSLDRDPLNADVRLAAPSAALGAFEDVQLFHPASLDAAFHGLFLEQKHVAGETRAHLPIRIHSAVLWRSGVLIERAVVKRINETELTKTVNIALLGPDGVLVADVRGAVLRAVVLSRRDDDERLFRMAYEPIERTRASGSVFTRGTAPSTFAHPPDGWLLVRAFARSLAFETVKLLATPDGFVLDIDSLREGGRITDESAPRLGSLLGLLEANGLAERAGEAVSLVEVRTPPDASLLLRTLVERFPAMNAEIRLCAHALAGLTRDREPFADASPDLVEQFESDSVFFRGALELLKERIDAVVRNAGLAIPHIVAASPWTAGLVDCLASFARTGRARVTLLGSDGSAFDRVALRHGPGVFGFADMTQTDTLPMTDLVVGLAFGPLFGGLGEQDLERLGSVVAGADVAVAAPVQDTTLDVLLGWRPDWYQASLDWQFPLSLVPQRDDTGLSLSRLGAINLQSAPLHDGLGTLFRATIQARIPMPETEGPLLVLPGEAARDFARALIGPQHPASIETSLGTLAQDLLGAAAAAAPDTNIDLAVLVGPDAEQPAAKALSHTLIGLKQVLTMAQDQMRKPRLWIVTRGAQQDGSDPLACAVAGFVRVATNEYPELDLHHVDVPDHATATAAQLRSLIARGSAEAEVAITTDAVLAARVQRGAVPVYEPASKKRRLELLVPPPGAASSLAWTVKDRAAPQAGEIEIAIAATGLNFRDVMLALGALDDDIIGAGVTGAALGFEFAGVVERVGTGVSGLKAGDRVMGFAAKAFASHLVCPAWSCFKVPDEMPLEAAATIPVAFATAWYGLVECARLKRGETVLIHGAAGGVGLAAVQIALSRGARVIGTAGTVEKATLLGVLGVEAVYGSRSLGFADEIARDYGGVDVVLNSLAGEAMTATLGLLKPFGRFVELGKRDFMANTLVGLRPFARNLSYHGVDLDQLLAHDRGIVLRMMSRMAKLLQSGQLRPLPYRLFEGDAVGEAFRTMQMAGHVGKIVVRPAALGRVAKAEPIPFKPAKGVHLVVGGTQGFGFETALWLASKGASTVVVASRGGLAEPALVERAKAIAKGRIVSEPVDVSDSVSVKDLVGKVEREHGPIRGVLHTAMVLQDGLIQGLSEDQLDAVLRPKVDGVVALEAATAACALDYFVVYSSAAALIGSPGQAAYVAANAYLEGAMRRRRAQGKPSLAVAWGAIADAGVLAKEQSLSQRLQRATGVTGVPVREALQFLDRMLVQGNAVAPVQIYADIRRGAVADQLAILRTPAFKHLFASGEQMSGGSAEAAAMIEGKTDAEALAILVPMLATEIGKILRLPAETIDPRRSLTDLGMDSLMALELRMSVEKRFNVELPLLGIGNGRSLADLAKVMIGNLRPTQAAQPSEAAGPVPTAADAALIERHGLDLADEQFGELAVAVDSRRKAAGRGS